MENISSLIDLFRRNDFIARIDLKDARSGKYVPERLAHEGSLGGCLPMVN